MGKAFEHIDPALEEFIRAQQVFFVATGPLSASGHINLSPKGLDTLRVLDPHTVAYFDYVGSGAETIAHLRENGRIVVMMCAFQGLLASSGCMVGEKFSSRKIASSISCDRYFPPSRPAAPSFASRWNESRIRAALGYPSFHSKATVLNFQPGCHGRVSRG